MALSVREIETTRHDPKKIIWLKDGKGLWLCIFKNGTMAWRARYQWNKKPAMLSLGIYPKVSLKDAREKNAAIRDLLDKGINPAKERLVVKKEVQNTTTFRHFADEWQTKQIHWSEKTRRINKQRIENFLYPVLADIEIRDLTEDDFIRAIQPLLDREVYELLGRVKRLFNSIYEYVREVYYHDLHNPAAYIGKRFPKPIKKHYPTITNRAEVGELLFTIEQNQYRATPIVYCAVQLAPLVLLRPSEIVEAKWDEINFRREEWHIQGDRMKKRREHTVPLSSQALHWLHELHKVTGKGVFLCPGRGRDTISTDALRQFLQRCGYKPGEFTTHGFRGMGSTILHEMDYNHAWIEMQLAHVEGSETSRAYNHAQYLPQRKKMMQEWADFLYGLKAQAAERFYAEKKEKAVTGQL